MNCTLALDLLKEEGLLEDEIPLFQGAGGTCGL